MHVYCIQVAVTEGGQVTDILTRMKPWLQVAVTEGYRSLLRYTNPHEALATSGCH